MLTRRRPSGAIVRENTRCKNLFSKHQTSAQWGDFPWSAVALYATEKGDRTS
jgi:hypothetical protein